MKILFMGVEDCVRGLKLVWFYNGVVVLIQNCVRFVLRVVQVVVVPFMVTRLSWFGNGWIAQCQIFGLRLLRNRKKI